MIRRYILTSHYQRIEIHNYNKYILHPLAYVRFTIPGKLACLFRGMISNYFLLESESGNADMHQIILAFEFRLHTEW